MLVLVGMGLYDELDLSLRGLQELKACDSVYVELYTSRMPGLSLSRLQELAGKEVRRLSRRELEEGAERLLEEAEHRRVALLVAGDPLISTTHSALRLEAEKRGIPVRVVHNASVYSAVPSAAGLHNYKFGRCATIPRASGAYMPETPYHVLRENLERGLHTMLLLDLTEGEEMSAAEGIEYLLELESRLGMGVFSPSTTAVVVAQVGAPECRITAGRAERLAELGEALGGTPHTLVVPGELHFMEEEWLRRFWVD
ncbi:MAG: diphthine synthase [Euryarchaeota archaeon]|nr:diphthine synthase [Euryarchaeota archaeon]